MAVDGLPVKDGLQLRLTADEGRLFHSCVGTLLCEVTVNLPENSA